MTAWHFGIQHQHTQAYPSLAPLAQDLLAAPASQACVERVFSVYVVISLQERGFVCART